MTSIKYSLAKGNLFQRHSWRMMLWTVPFVLCCFIPDALCRSCILISMLCCLVHRHPALYWISTGLTVLITAVFYLEELAVLLISLVFLNLLFQAVSLSEINRFTSLPFLAAAATAVEMMLRLYDFPHVLMGAVAAGFCTYILDKDNGLNLKAAHLWKIILLFLLCFPSFFTQSKEIIVTSFAFSAVLASYLLDLRTLIFFLTFSIVFALKETGIAIAVITILCSCIPADKKRIRTGMFIMLLLLYRSDMETIFSGISALAAAFLADKLSVERNEEDEISLSLDRQTSDCSFQLQQFSKIFECLADHYKGTPLETELMTNMGKTLYSMSLQIKSSSQNINALHKKIMEVLEGYQFEIVRLNIEMDKEGRISLRLHCMQCTKQEITSVIVPLLEKCLHKKLKITSLVKSRSKNGYVILECSSAECCKLQVHPYTFSKEKVSGDQYSVFECKDQTCVILSDGMGCGAEAREESRFLIELAQRMIACQMPLSLIAANINECMTLTRKERFATLDFLCFDRSSKEAYMIKSGSCPTYLIRNKCVLEIKGEGLPLGIIQKIKPDCFKIACRKGDIFVMVSDGVEAPMLEKWLKEDKAKLEDQIRASMKNPQGQFKDDATILLIQVQSI